MKLILGKYETQCVTAKLYFKTSEDLRLSFQKDHFRDPFKKLSMDFQDVPHRPLIFN